MRLKLLQLLRGTLSTVECDPLRLDAALRFFSFVFLQVFKKHTKRRMSPQFRESRCELCVELFQTRPKRLLRSVTSEYSRGVFSFGFFE